MRLNLKQRKAITKQFLQRYARASQNPKHIILDEFCYLTQYNRSYACWLLKKPFHQGNSSAPSASLPIKALKTATNKYDGKVLAALTKIWMILNCLCSKRLAPFLPEVIIVLERHHELQFDEETTAKLKQISASTIDRLLAPERQKFQLEGKSRANPVPCSKSRFPSASLPTGMRKKKECVGSQVKKLYERVLAAQEVSEHQKKQLRRQYEELNPA